MTAVLPIVFDAGMLILIWMVQLIIYPSFAYYNPDELKKWHNTYTRKISLLVIPLMFGQLGAGIYELIDSGTVLSVIKITLIVCVWVITFAQFVPLHGSIDQTNPKELPLLVKTLVKKNRPRTLLWTLIFLIGLWQTLAIPYQF